MATRSDPPKEEHSALAAKFKGRRRSSSQKGFQKNFQENTKGAFKGKSFDISKVKCYNSNKMGHFARDYRSKKKGNYKRGKHHASTTEDEESKKRQKGSASEKEKRKEYYLVSTLSGSLTTGRDTWLVDSGTSKHMTGYKDILSEFKKMTFSDQVELGDDRSYEIQGIGSVATLEDKGYIVTFTERKVLLWPKDGQMNSVEIIGV